jgi:hypothetical protein
MSNPPAFTQEEIKILKRIPFDILLLSLAGALIALFFFTAMTALFVLAGGIFSAASFLWLKNSLSRFLLHSNTKKMLQSVLGSYLLRLLLIIAVFSIIIIFFTKKIFAFVAGFSTIILVILAEAIIALPKIKKWKN